MDLLGVHEATIRWIGSFLTGHSQIVAIGQVYSHPVTPNGGIPQGTICVGTKDIGLNTLMTPRYVNLFLDVRLTTFHLLLQILTPTLP